MAKKASDKLAEKWLLSRLEDRVKQSSINPDSLNQETMNKLIHDEISKLASDFITETLRDKHTVLAQTRSQQSRTALAVDAIWGEALDILEVYIEVCARIGDEFVDKHLSPTPSYDVLYALAILHIQASLVAAEMLVLLRTGYASGANARSRTLYELSVVSQFIRTNGDQVAERYIRHGAIEDYKTAEVFRKHAEALGVERIPDDEFEKLKNTRDSLLKRFGNDFKNQYGWAAEVLEKPNPRYADIEMAVGWEEIRALYKLASQSIHPLFRGMSQTVLGPKGTKRVLSREPSPVGLVNPGLGIAKTLYVVTINLLLTHPSAWTSIWIETVAQIRSVLEQSFDSARASAGSP